MNRTWIIGGMAFFLAHCSNDSKKYEDPVGASDSNVQTANQAAQDGTAFFLCTHKEDETGSLCRFQLDNEALTLPTVSVGISALRETTQENLDISVTVNSESDSSWHYDITNSSSHEDILYIAAVELGDGSNATYVSSPMFFDISDDELAIEDLELVAKKVYNPDIRYNAIRILPEVRSIQLPETIEVISGNGGNNLAKIVLDNDICYYQAGASVSSPLESGDTDDITAGQTYTFDNCDESSSLVHETKAIKLIADHGDESASTVIKAILSVSSSN